MERPPFNASIFIPGKPAITTDYHGGEGVNPYPNALKNAADAGFEYFHWCHRWNGDHLYTRDEIRAIKRTFKDLGVHLLDTHASEGDKKYWLHTDPSVRQAGLTLIRNRMALTQELGGSAIVLHVPGEPVDESKKVGFWDTLKSNVDQLQDFSKKSGVRIAFENLYREGSKPENFSTLQELLAHYPPEFVGMCLDTGHWNMENRNYKALWPYRDRIIAVHLHDNPGRDKKNPDMDTDYHMLPGSGTVPWHEVMRLLAHSSYVMEAPRPLSFEHSMKMHEAEGMTEPQFLQSAMDVGIILAGHVNDAILKRITQGCVEKAVFDPAVLRITSSMVEEVLRGH